MVHSFACNSQLLLCNYPKNMVYSTCYLIVIKIYALLLRFSNQVPWGCRDCMGFNHPETHSGNLSSVWNKQLPSLCQYQQQQLFNVVIVHGFVMEHFRMTSHMTHVVIEQICHAFCNCHEIFLCNNFSFLHFTIVL